MTTSAVTQLRQLQRSLYEKAYAEAHAIGGSESRAMLSYSAKFERSLPKTFEHSTLASLIDDMRRHRYVLYGDFHILRQSQRGLLRLIRSYGERLRTNKMVIALEMFKARDQDYIDAYLAGRLTEQQLLAQVNYHEEWGFPWPNFRMILDYARARKLPVIGINTDNGGRDTLAVRDRYAAERLCDAATRFPEHKIFCLIGEFHLADQHLPKALAAEQKRRDAVSSVLRVVNNVDRYYFELQRESAANSTEYLQLKKSFYCVMNSPPWMKWQTFAMWEEMRHSGLGSATDDDGDADPDLDLLTEDTFDVDYQFFQFVKNLAGFLGLKIDSSDLESFRIHFSRDGDFFADFGEDDRFDEAESNRLIERASIDGVHFVCRSKTVLLTDVSINNLAEAAGQYLQTLLTGFDDSTGAIGHDFLRRIIKSAVGMIASKILNPRRKCLELHHHKQIARRYKGQRLTGAASSKREIASAVMKFDKWIVARLLDADDGSPEAPRGLVILDRRSHYQLSREIGQMLGFGLYKKVIAGKVPAARMKRLFKKKAQTPGTAWAEICGLYRLMIG